jgi:hypothetical protein
VQLVDREKLLHHYHYLMQSSDLRQPAIDSAGCADAEMR